MPPKKPTLLLIALCLSSSVRADTFQFEALLTADAVVPDAPENDPISTATGTAIFTLTTDGFDGPELSYSISLNGLNYDTTLPRETLDGPDTQVRAVHIHFGAIGSNGSHALNIYGFPREDDLDLLVGTSSLTGIWDDSDENLGPNNTLDSGDSVALTDALDELMAEELYIQIHTFGYRQGELRGQITQIPEPATLTQILLITLAGLFTRRPPRQL